MAERRVSPVSREFSFGHFRDVFAQPSLIGREADSAASPRPCATLGLLLGVNVAVLVDIEIDHLTVFVCRANPVRTILMQVGDIRVALFV